MKVKVGTMNDERGSKTQRMKRCFTSSFIVLTSSFLLGCGPYAQVQIDLLDQSRKGVEHARASQRSYAAAVDQLHALRRKQLDAAFDRDARDQPTMDADWVIEARQAYAAALDALDRQRAADQAAADTAQRNLDAVDQALGQLRWLQGIPATWLAPDAAKPK